QFSGPGKIWGRSPEIYFFLTAFLTAFLAGFAAGLGAGAFLATTFAGFFSGAAAFLSLASGTALIWASTLTAGLGAGSIFFAGGSGLGGKAWPFIRAVM